jgi:hypothetical protein
MKPETDHTRKFTISRRLLYFPAFLFIFSTSYTQETTSDDSLFKTHVNIPPLDVITIRLSFIAPVNSAASKLIPPSGSEDEKTLIFLDSLKNKASKTLITRKLYDFVIISHGPESGKVITGSSDGSFRNYSGMKIRKIEIKRLGVFGTNINLPGFYDPNKIENILNKTHFNTNENIIRKNLLFNEGDTISPLILSDNERYIRDLPYIDDARILIVPVSDVEADIIVVTKDVYSLGANFNFSGFDKGSLSVFEKNIFGMGHQFGIEIPYNSDLASTPGFGVNYLVNNFSKTFINAKVYYYDALGRKTYGIDLNRKLVSATTKYAGGISAFEMFTSDDLDSLPEPVPVKYTFQDYWLLRSFLVNKESVTRLIFGARYTNNNVFSRPYIDPYSYHHLQKYQMFLGSVSLSVQKYYKASLIYGYGRTEDIPHGVLYNITFGRELNEFKKRFYLGSSLSVGEPVRGFGYFYTSIGFAAFFNEGQTEQGMILLRTNFFSNLAYIGRYRIRNFANVDYTRGIGRYSDEYLDFIHENGFSGFRNDSTGNSQRLTLSFESVLFSPANFYGFRFAVYGFADCGFLFGTHDLLGSGDILSSIGLGIRIRNDNLVFNTLQIRLCFYPNLPDFSRTNHLIISGEQLLKPDNFEPVKPSILPFK